MIDIITKKGFLKSFLFCFDHTMVSVNIKDAIREWRVEKELFVSDHRTIIFVIEILGPELEPKRKVKKTGWKEYNDELGARAMHL